MTADELVATLASLPGVRRVAASAPLSHSVQVAGIEVAATSEAPEPALRRVWRERHRGGATPLLLLADDGRPGTILTLGVLDASGLLRRVEAGALAQVLRRVSTLTRLEATRELTAELDRLDLSGIPGLKVRGLLTDHTLESRLRRDRARWEAAHTAIASIPRSVDWRGVLTGLGYQLERRPVRGYIARYDGRPVAVVHPKADPADFARLDPEGRPPEGVLLNDCAEVGARFALLASGGRLRLLDAGDEGGGVSSRYLDLDNAYLRDEDRPLLALLGPPYLAQGGFAGLIREAREFGTALRQRLDQRIRDTVLPALGAACGAWAGEEGMDLSSDAVRAELERASLTLIFRLLFMLYAESSRYLPIDNRAYHQNSLTRLVEETEDTRDDLDERSTALWDRYVLLVRAMRNGNRAWGVPPYNGALFGAGGFDGAAMLERMSVADPAFATVLIGLGRDPDTGTGVDYSTLDIGHLGHIYEALLSLRLTQAAVALRYDRREDSYRPALAGEAPDHLAGQLMWMTNEGGRKGGGVYYTRSELVRHLVRQSVVPAFERHLADVREIGERDPSRAAHALLDFAVVDPACGSAHFLVTVLNEIADRVVRFLATTPLPAVAESIGRLRSGATAGLDVDDVALIRRLVLKRCVHGVDLSPMGAEVAKVSLWLASFVPGLSLAYLGSNVIVGNSLVGVARPESVAADGLPLLNHRLEPAIQAATQAAVLAASIEDRTPEEVAASERAAAEARAAMAAMERVFDLWTSEAFGVKGARAEVELHGVELLEGSRSALGDTAAQAAKDHRFLHWPLAFPLVFFRERPGFDAVVGNPPWNEVTAEALAFLTLFSPGLRGLPEREREPAIADLLSRRPELALRLEQAKRHAQEERSYLAAGDYTSMPGDPDVYKYFCQRYRALIRDSGRLGVVLPRSAFVAEGSRSFRNWLFESMTCERIDFLVNRRLWLFDTHPQYTVALVAASNRAPSVARSLRLAGTATSLGQWSSQSESAGIELPLEATGPGHMVPLLRDQQEADLLARLRRGNAFPYGAGQRWRCFAVGELHETHDKPLWRGATSGRQLWKGESFDQFDPHGAESRPCPESDAVLRKVRKSRPGADSALAKEVALEGRRNAVLRELNRARVAFRDVSRATDSRTVRACLVPPRVFLTNKAPYLAFVDAGPREQAACLGLMNSLPFDWQTRRFVETNLNFFILEGLRLPELSDEDFGEIARAAARLSCPDERFADFAAAFSFEPGALEEHEREWLRVEIDARACRAWALDEADLTVMLRDFTLDAVPATYRQRLLRRLAEL